MKLKTIAVTVALLCGLAAGRVEARPYPLRNILGDRDAAELAKKKILTTSELLKRGAEPKARQELARSTGIPLAKITAWTQMCDLLRIHGVGPQMAKLMASAKVHTVKQLRRQKPAPLAKRMLKANEKVKITEVPPNAEQLRNWIAQAKKLKVVLH